MVQTWHSEDNGTERCAKCNQLFKITVTRLPAKDDDKYVCPKCGEVVRKWCSTHSFSFEPIDYHNPCQRPDA